MQASGGGVKHGVHAFEEGRDGLPDEGVEVVGEKFGILGVGAIDRGLVGGLEGLVELVAHAERDEPRLLAGPEQQGREAGGVGGLQAADGGHLHELDGGLPGPEGLAHLPPADGREAEVAGGIHQAAGELLLVPAGIFGLALLHFPPMLADRGVGVVFDVLAQGPLVLDQGGLVEQLAVVEQAVEAQFGMPAGEVEEEGVLAAEGAVAQAVADDLVELAQSLAEVFAADAVHEGELARSLAHAPEVRIDQGHVEEHCRLAVGVAERFPGRHAVGHAVGHVPLAQPHVAFLDQDQ